ncbi:UDP-3-O-(3-hydroxymyristoyl)glucosamine N-acyltransferase [Phyllobacterium sp. 21LDTY02-6]|jgi:UDP-3-O-[3-hydroxymyristoyl] glucosamine N-acyltransferase|uniref:UDP-3-O-(3-hydroxymyristoyl)glucosamine N-acyltransferase n=1 Tax=unclassified Phyllobacterium TaxID=2638441 RepID=UPI002021ED98|nr:MULTISPECIES: UDP-3-O-(3-hydroxymyristoyl)glucosamine N-acyltransferase [unclassified Phyllobacterium]MCO4316509.1 UDP-3-O-(3-hydroxymyristoyl)glucosamine N-acyltransferase [Phyllobacterium sp. 21LDTY02-6]MCX8280689.1 UDP-3-O-(3-hydroxymyristoyl)glucosamine N-acyltransferase [Phyllobacterium sp. 0TCS1.6C]MCX8292734.1 UDP-3-O-(3-hydroxymyristoyl)glucosamine N-acyltransferase [Phyllobacterium sp. 0TCS1.6A]
MADPIFYDPLLNVTVGQIADLTNGVLVDSSLAERPVTRLASLSQSGPDAVVFVESKKHAQELGKLNAACVLCTEEIRPLIPKKVAIIVTRHPQQDFAAIGRALYPNAVKAHLWTGQTGVSTHAIIHESAEIEDDVTIEAGVVIGSNVSIGAGTVIAANVVIGNGCKIGRDCYIGPGSSIQYAFLGNRVLLHPGVRIGQDGFGYVAGRTGLAKMPQLGRAVVQDDVEIGANTTIDRGALADTVIGEGTKIDNLVQIAHNVTIGRHCVIAAQCGISGSVVLGDLTRLGGSVGIKDHVNIGTGVEIAAASGVMSDIPDGERWAGAPAQPLKQWFREIASVRAMTRTKKENNSDE